ncbi:MAG: hypothetical protein U0350_36430 [Caldilineaceae bacterium]
MLQSAGASRLKLVLPVQAGAARYALHAIFTTSNGQWYPSDNPFSIEQWAIDQWGKASFMERGAATHILVRVENQDGTAAPATVFFRNGDSSFSLGTANKPSGWQNMPIYDSYNPGNGEHGGWAVFLDGADLGVKGIGLPYNWHVSTFIVFRALVTPQPPPDPQPDEPAIIPLVISRPTTIQIAASAPFMIEVNQ